MQCKIPPLSSSKVKQADNQVNWQVNKNSELSAFDQLPQELRYKVNYSAERIDPRQILGILKQQGLSQALSYLEDIATTQRN